MRGNQGQARRAKGKLGFLRHWYLLIITTFPSSLFADISELDTTTVAKVEFPDPQDKMRMLIRITPEEGYWRGATYVFSVDIPHFQPYTYPYAAPKVRCQTPIYHPNIDPDGSVCLNILRDNWQPIYDLNTVVYGLIHLFSEPNADGSTEPAVCMRERPDVFERNVQLSLAGGTIGTTTFPRLL